MSNDKSITITFTPQQVALYKQAWGLMPFGGGLHLSYDITPDAITADLKLLADTLSRFSKRNTDELTELRELREQVRTFGKLFAKAVQLAAGK